MAKNDLQWLTENTPAKRWHDSAIPAEIKAFYGGFKVALAEGQDFFEAVAFGNIAAGLSVTRVGSSTAMPYRTEIDQSKDLWRSILEYI